jgi:hypothetical protein
MKVKVGQIWKEQDNRFDRYVKVLLIVDNVVAIQTITRKINGREYDARSRPTTYARIDRFNGKHGGYEFYAKNVTDFNKF